ncbi:protein of unknown function (plasmid) [Cupriavidus taiwanensis]|uniref:Uncharacterized protein n=1 Tax=Cupriavidus taiwanensis TaxID=164546 RepID=A0A375HFY3_9BURK|nr:hypothetical protein CBM2614_U10003 [Cupriavidus taiwanensis]SOZ73288.1 hypothetical protein CBM2615_U10003 [Cupriavidus taiwanensis]SOZ75215.1 hypothetical protein CBM2613_U10117 [Cupriavidus taiwanensis]SPA03677.1 protein of unknown function [Cupriavidus taiwanensis]SPA11574.1 protein of unknown function [Cupriavidus taiwanensis]
MQSDEPGAIHRSKGRRLDRALACSGVTKAQNAFEISINYPSMEEAWEQRSRYVQWLTNGLHRP